MSSVALKKILGGIAKESTLCLLYTSTVTLHDKESAQRLAAVEQLDIINVCGRKVQIRVKKELPNTLRVLANYQPTDLQTETQSLEELFLHYYGEGGHKNA